MTVDGDIYFQNNLKGKTTWRDPRTRTRPSRVVVFDSKTTRTRPSDSAAIINWQPFMPPVDSDDTLKVVLLRPPKGKRRENKEEARWRGLGKNADLLEGVT